MEAVCSGEGNAEVFIDFPMGPRQPNPMVMFWRPTASLIADAPLGALIPMKIGDSQPMGLSIGYESVSGGGDPTGINHGANLGENEGRWYDGRG